MDIDGELCEGPVRAMNAYFLNFEVERALLDIWVRQITVDTIVI